jgi:ParB family transcriptional regulator, chromosome partitioning protein
MMGRRVDFADLAKRNGVPRPASVEGVGDVGVRRVPIDSVALNPLNKRPDEDAELGELAETIRQHGVIQPLVVCSTAAYLAEFPTQESGLAGASWVTLIGNRRLRAMRMAEVPEALIVINDDRVTSMYEVMLVENGQRVGLPATLEAEAMVAVLGREKISQAELARRIGKSAPYVTQRLALLDLVPELRAAFDAGELTVKLARDFGALPPEQQATIVAAGKPYRFPSVPKPSVRRINAASPEAAAESIRKTFSPEELARLIALLTG